VPPEIQGKIFDPFFYDQAVGKAPARLDIVQRIVRTHHGLIRLESRPGRTAFQVRCPELSRRRGLAVAAGAPN